MLEYKQPENLPPQKIIDILETENINDICNAIISIGFYEYEKKWTEDILLKNINSDNLDIASAAITSLGHAIRTHRDIDTKKWLKALDSIPFRLQLQGIIQDVIDDISIYAKPQ